MTVMVDPQMESNLSAESPMSDVAIQSHRQDL